MKKKQLDYELTQDNIFDDLGLEQPEELLARARLLDAVGDIIKKSQLTQKEIARRLKISQPKVSLLVTGRLSAFTTETLFHYLIILGCHVDIRLRRPKSRVGIFRERGHLCVK